MKFLINKTAVALAGLMLTGAAQAHHSAAQFDFRNTVLVSGKVVETRFANPHMRLILEVTDDKRLAKEVRKQLQIDHAPHISTAAKLVKLADKICNLRDILASPPAGWTDERKGAYFDWAAQVVAGLRGVHYGLETAFDAVHGRRNDLR